MQDDASRPHLKIDEKKSPTIRTFEGGGGATYPREEYKRHAKKIFKEAQQLHDFFNTREDKNIIKKKYFRVELPEDMNILTSTGKDISKSVLADLVGSPEKNIGHFSTSESSFTDLMQQLKNYSDSSTNAGKSKFSPIEDLGKIPAAEKITPALHGLIKENKYSGEILVSIFKDLTRSEQEALKKAISIYLKPNGGEILSETDTSSGKVFRVKAKSDIIDSLAESFLAIQAVDPIEEIVVEQAVSGKRIEDTVTVHPNTSKAKVCIFDSGVVRNSRFLDNSMLGHEEPLGPPFNVSHGTFVASRIIYGNSLRDKISQGNLYPDVKVLSICMGTHNDIGNPIRATAEEAIKIIRETVGRMHNEIKVYNMSMCLNYQNTTTGSLVSDKAVGGLAAEIDNLSKKYGVLFVLAAGNYPTDGRTPPPSEPYPKHFENKDARVTQPAEAMLALTVGSITDRQNAGSITSTDMPSPFTRSGPGFNNYRKPDIVAQGGNLTQHWLHFDDLAVAGLSESGNHIAFGSGTSYSAPIIARLAAQLFENIKTATPDLVRAMLIHSSALLESKLLDDEMKVKLMGNGLPNPEYLLSSDRWNQTYIVQGEIGYREKIRIPFYIPKALTERDGKKKIALKLTLASSPDTDRTKGQGYCKSHLSVNVFKLSEDGELKKCASSNKGEEKINDRYSTVIRYAKTFSKNIDGGDWELLLEHVSTRCEPTDEKVPYSIAITISDPRKDKDIDIFNSIRIEAPNRYETLIQTQNKLRI